MAALSVVVVHFGAPEPTLRLTREYREDGLDVTIVDHGGFVSDAPDGARLLRPGSNEGFGAGANRGAAGTDAEIVAFVNPDVRLAPQDLRAAAAVLARERSLGALSPSLAWPDGRAQLCGGSFSGWATEVSRALRVGKRLRGVRARLRRETRSGPPTLLRRQWISGALMLVRREAFDAVQGFDAGYFLYFEDEDLCRRLAQAGWGSAVWTGATAIHDVGGAYGGSHYERSRERYHRRWSGPALRRFVIWSARRRLNRLPPSS